jgi:hypothetical protein
MTLGVGLSEGWVLPAKALAKKQRRDRGTSLQGLHELVDDERLGHAARTAIRCVEERDADPRLLLLVIEAAEEGYFGSPGRLSAERREEAT